MFISIDPDDEEPAYEQIARQIRGQILSGRLPSGSRLPGIRSLMMELNEAGQQAGHNTVQRAYELLSREGFIEPTPQAYVVRVRTGDVDPSVVRFARRGLRRLLQILAWAGYDKQQLLEDFHRVSRGEDSKAKEAGR